jgi:hypothetical protein
MSMPRVAGFALGLLLATTGAAAQRPDPCTVESSASDVQFTLALKDHGVVFQAGEIIPVTLTFSSSTKGRYTAELRDNNRIGPFGLESYCVTPAAPDPLESYFNNGVFAGSILESEHQLDKVR